ncbi:MAG: hypothetical protein LBE22_08000 [Azoarcus sp.]|nr:hypothetical protein [Azoarcus sp.]
MGLFFSFGDESFDPKTFSTLSTVQGLAASGFCMSSSSFICGSAFEIEQNRQKIPDRQANDPFSIALTLHVNEYHFTQPGQFYFVCIASNNGVVQALEQQHKHK